MSIKDIVLTTVLGYTGIRLSDLTKKGKGSRKRELVEARQMVCYFLYKNDLKLSLTRIGWVVDLNHATVFHSIEKITNRIETEPKFRRVINMLQLDILESIENRRQLDAIKQNTFIPSVTAGEYRYRMQNR